MKLYNSASHQIEEINLTAQALGVYTCGPTVYDYPHIGNWFTFIRYDILVRTLRAAGFETKWVMNITDVGHLVSDADEGEDKLEKGARREGRTAWEVAQYYTDHFLDGLNRLNIDMPDVLPKATDHIPEQIELIKKLEDQGYTYRIDDGIYFNTAKFKTYAKFAGLRLNELQGGARVELNTQKMNVSDFALWKFSPQNHERDMEWESPWGRGFPGWHLECSAMAVKYLGATVDIHGGGIDHIPVHHTNEIAQSEAAFGVPYVKYWFHANHISVEGQKISKSLGNGFTLDDLADKGGSPPVIRMYALESHYRTQSKFSLDGLGAAKQRLYDLYALATLRWQYTEHETTISNTGAAISECKSAVQKALQYDLNTPQALSALSELQNKLSNGVPRMHQEPFEELLRYIDSTLGLDLLSQADIPDSIKEQLHQRGLAREQADWSSSDSIRVELSKQAIGVRDTPNGQIWYRIED